MHATRPIRRRSLGVAGFTVPAGAALIAMLLAATLLASCVDPSGVRPTVAAAPVPVIAPRTGGPAVLFQDTFTRPDGLVTNEFAMWNPSSSLAVVSPDWEMTSGSLFARNGLGWSGVPDGVSPDARSASHTDSAVFRLTTRRADFTNVRVAFDLRMLRLVTTPRTPPVDWDGVHVFLRYQSEYSLYYASVDRRDGTVAIKKKVPGGSTNGGTYSTLATGRHAWPSGRWEHVTASVVTNRDGSVTIELRAGGALLARATDDGRVGGPPIRAAGKTGIRGDNAEFEVDAFTVTPAT